MAEKQVNGLRFRDLWSSSLEIYQANFKAFILLSMIALAIDVPWMIYRFLIHDNQSIIYNSLLFARVIIDIFIQIWIFAILTLFIMKYLNTQHLSFTKIRDELRGIYWRVLGIYFVNVLIVFSLMVVVLMISIIILILLRLPIQMIFTTPIFTCTPLIYFLLTAIVIPFFIFAPTIGVLGNRKKSAFSQSFSLVKRRYLRVFLLLFPLFTITMGFPTLLISLRNLFNQCLTINFKLLVDVFNSIYYILVFPITTAFVTLLYLKLKITKAEEPIE